MALLSFALAMVVFAQMTRLQVISPDAAIAAGERQRTKELVLVADRGDFVDRTGVPLAMSVHEWLLVANPKQIREGGADQPAKVAAALAPILGAEASAIQPLLVSTNEKKQYQIVARSLDDATAERVREKKLNGLILEDSARRVYPAGDLGRSVVGKVSKDKDGVDTGASGLELRYNGQLLGRDGLLKAERAYGRQIAGTPQTATPAKRGRSYVLTLDRSLTYAVEGMLAATIAMTGARSGTVVVSQVATGDVLVMANMELKDDGSVVSRYNCALVCAYEPGSVTKPMLIAAALEEKVVRPTTHLDVKDSLELYDHVFTDDESHPTMSWTPRDILVNSSNVGTIMIARKLEASRVYDYFRRFGFGTRTGIDFPGETKGFFPAVKRWNGTSIGAIPIGQAMSVNAAQMLDAYNTLANGGVRTPLRLVRATVDDRGRTVAEPTPKGERVVSSETATQVTDMLTDVVREGTGQAARLDGYTVAGKTGTAQRSDGKGGYRTDAYTASFAGFFPAERPEISAIVVLDEPQTSIYGGVVAAPLFAEVARYTAAHYRIAPSPGTTSLSGSGTKIVNREATQTKRDAAWQQAIIRRAALASAPEDPSVMPVMPVPTDSALPAAPSAATSARTATSTASAAPAAPLTTVAPITLPPTTAAPTTAAPTTAAPTTAAPKPIDMGPVRPTSAAPRARAASMDRSAPPPGSAEAEAAREAAAARAVADASASPVPTTVGGN